MSMMIKHERAVLAEPERMPGLRSSFLCKFYITQLWKATLEDSTDFNSKMSSIEMALSKAQMHTNFSPDNSIDYPLIHVITQARLLSYIKNINIKITYELIKFRLLDQSIFFTIKCSITFKSLIYIFSNGISFIMNYFCPESKVTLIFPVLGTNIYPIDYEQSSYIYIFLSCLFSIKYSIMLLFDLRNLTLANFSYFLGIYNSLPKCEMISQ